VIDAVAIRGLTKRYGATRVLANVNLDLSAGSLCALLGPNGAGKTTLLGIVSTLVRPSSGQIAYRAGSEEVPAGGALRRAIGVLAHDSFLYGGLSAIENLAFYARLYELEDGARRAATLLDEVGLAEEARGRPVRTYSPSCTSRSCSSSTSRSPASTGPGPRPWPAPWPARSSAARSCWWSATTSRRWPGSPITWRSSAAASWPTRSAGRAVSASRS
jgi:hypothetical protein